MQAIIEKLKGKLIVSCQALKNEPLHSSMIMARMAYAAMLGGAKAIRANSYEDIVEIKKTVDLPVFGIVKRDYEDSDVYITATMREIDELMAAKADIIALDATSRPRPNGKSLDQFVREIRAKYDNIILMGDISTVEEGIHAAEIGFDIVSTTMSGYTPYSPQIDTPDYELISGLAGKITIPVMAEGKIWTREEAVQAFRCGAHAVIVGTAITRPMNITERFAKAIEAANV